MDENNEYLHHEDEIEVHGTDMSGAEDVDNGFGIETSEIETPIADEEIDGKPLTTVDVTSPTFTGQQEDIYNQQNTTVDDETIDEEEDSSLDCRSECKYNTGDRWKYAKYGFSD